MVNDVAARCTLKNNEASEEKDDRTDEDDGGPGDGDDAERRRRRFHATGPPAGPTHPHPTATAPSIPSPRSVQMLTEGGTSAAASALLEPSSTCSGKGQDPRDDELENNVDDSSSSSSATSTSSSTSNEGRDRSSLPGSGNGAPRQQPEAAATVPPLKLYGRDREAEELVQAFHRCVGGAGGAGNNGSTNGSDGARELLLVTGGTGTGKTSLVESVLRPLATGDAAGGYFVSGKFDLLGRTEQYYPVVQALAQFAQAVSSVPARLHDVQARLEPYKETTRVLVDWIPCLSDLVLEDDQAAGEEELSSLVTSSRCSRRTHPAASTTAAATHASTPGPKPLSSPASSSVAGPGAATRERLQFAIRQFLEAVSSRTSPFLLFLDDLQWAEPASLDLIAYLFNHRIPGLVLVGACRDNELSSFAHLSVLLRELETSQVRITQVPLSNLGVTALSYMASDVFQMNYAKAKVLGGIIFDRTGGNMFFVVQLLRTLAEEALLYTTSDGTWTFDPEARIASYHGLASDCDSSNDADAAALVKANLLKQDEAVKETLMIASCLGAEFSLDLLRVAVSFELDHPLRVSEAKGFLKRLESGSHGGSTLCRFVHDQIQQGAYALIPSHEREAVHLQIGRKLWTDLSEEDLDEHASVVVKQLRLGARLIVNEDEREHLAVLLLRAGELASRAAAHLTALDYITLAMSMLGRRHWRDQYQLSLRVYNSAAEVEYCVGNFDRVDELTKKILDNARSKKDKIRAQTNRMYSLGSRNHLQQAIDLGLLSLKEYCGISFPAKPSVISIIMDQMKTKRMLRRQSDESILSLPKMEDTMQLAAMRIMVILFTYTLTGRPNVSPHIASKLVRYSLRHGISGMTSPAFSMYSLIISVAFHDPDSCVRFGKLAIVLLHMFDAREWLPRVHCAVFLFCFPYNEPLRNQIQPLLLAHRVGLGGGDIEFAMVSAGSYISVSIFSSIRLSVLSSEIETFLSLSDYYQQRNMVQFIRPHAQFIQCMRGACRDPSILSGDALNLELATKEALETKNAMVLSLITMYRMLVASYFRQYDEAETMGKELSTQPGMAGFPCFMKGVVWLHEGLALVTLSYFGRRRRRMSLAKQNLRRLSRLCAYSKLNYGNKVSLLEAEIAVAEGKFHQARLKYENSIAEATEAKQWSEVGLACERMSISLLRRKRVEDAMNYLDQAASAYERWGATAKVLEIRSSAIVDGAIRTSLAEELVSLNLSRKL